MVHKSKSDDIAATELHNRLAKRIVWIRPSKRLSLVCIHSFTIYRRSRNPRPSKIAGIAFSIRAVRVPDCFAPAK